MSAGWWSTGRLIVNGALTLQQTHALVTAAAAAKAGQGHMAAGEAECRQHVMRGAISVLAQYISSAELQQQMKAAGLQPQHNSAQVSTRANPSWLTRVVWVSTQDERSPCRHTVIMHVHVKHSCCL